MIVTIEVDEECIKTGYDNDPKCCPVALALRKKLKTTVLVGGLTIKIEGINIPLPRNVSLFILDFDNIPNHHRIHADSYAFRFDLDIPSHLLKEEYAS